MPMIQTFQWENVHEWVGDKWNEEGHWTDGKMTDELNALDEFRAKTLPKMTLLELVKTIIEERSIRVGNKDYDFQSLYNIFDAWKHFTNTCVNYGREWIAQDESHLRCFEYENKNCDSFNKSCPKYKPMLKLTPIEELAGQVKVVLT
jgi:hypothetical protein